MYRCSFVPFLIEVNGYRIADRIKIRTKLVNQENPEFATVRIVEFVETVESCWSQKFHPVEGFAVKLTKLEVTTSAVTAGWFGMWTFPPIDTASMANSAMSGAFAFAAMLVIISWVKDGTDRHL